jgi:hypothetical protein
MGLKGKKNITKLTYLSPSQSRCTRAREKVCVCVCVCVSFILETRWIGRLRKGYIRKSWIRKSWIRKSWIRKSCNRQSWIWKAQISKGCPKLKTKTLLQSPPLNWITDNRISRLLLSEIAGPSIPWQYTKLVGYLNHSLIAITFMLSQSDSIKRRVLYLKARSKHVEYLDTEYLKL